MINGMEVAVIMPAYNAELTLEAISDLLED